MKQLGKRLGFLFSGKRIQKYLPNKDEQASFLSLFRYAQTTEKILIALGILGALASGTVIPLLILIYGEFTTLLVERKGNLTFDFIILPIFGGGREVINGTAAEIADASRADAQAFGLALIVILIIDIICSIIGVSCLNYAALRQISRIRRMFMKSVISKDMTWFDQNAETNFSVNVTEGLNNMQDGMGEKIAFFLNKTSAFVISIIVSFVYGWELTLAILATVPIIAVSGMLVSKVQTSMVVKEQKALGIANTLAEEVFTSIKTVIAFGGEEKELERYKNKLQGSASSGIKRAMLNGFGMGLNWFQIYGAYALGFWYGVELYLESRESGDERYTPQVIPIVLFGLVMASMGIGVCASYWESFILAKGSSAIIFKCLDTPSQIDSFSTEGKKLDSVRGAIEFHGIQFSYPARPNVAVLKGLNLKIREGAKVALVGSSGSGKSTAIQLIQRLYDPSRGTVTLDGVNIRDLNVNWYRQQIGIVSQEPQLFATSIFENIQLGMPEAGKDEIEKAAKMANAHDFITALPKGYETVIGERGTMLSGGQKQRIAIARAILRNPKILLLDEATSALDTSNEKAVQIALDKASEGRTTIVVAHRLSTIKNADEIIVLSNGKFVESGTHDELIKLQGEYYKLQNLQNTSTTETKGNTEGKTNSGPRFSLTDTKISEHDTLSDEKELEDLSGEEIKPASLSRILSYSKKEWYAFIPGILATLVVGASTPIFAILFGDIFGDLGENDAEIIRERTTWNSLMLLLLAVSVGVSLFIQMYSFGHITVKLSSRLRTLTFDAILHQEPAWFDREENRVGALSAKLSGSIGDIQGIAGSALSMILQGITSVFIGLIVSFIYSWKMTLVTCCALPLLFFGVYYEFYVVQGQNLLEKKVIEGATKVAVEGLSCIRTVAGLGREDYFVQKYSEELRAGETVMKKKSFLRGFIFGVGQSATFIGYLISLWYGGDQVADGEMEYKDVIKISEALLFGVWILGQSLAFAPNYGKAKLSAGRIFAILDRAGTIKDGTSNEKMEPKGRIEYENVAFAYPTRPEVKVLQGLSMRIEPCSSVAFAGASGCGKSTLVQLLLRLYDLEGGSIRMDGQDIRHIRTKALRSHMSLVSQEPVLFDMTIAENIAYGDNSRRVERDEIIKAAKAANIHNFIASLPEGYETGLGKGGAQLSGGQKQRIAIARALVRNPRVLLLDEATSALDAESESVVQAALGKAMEGRTTITIGHRLGAISGADVICVLEHGKIVEQGTHDQLIARKGAYARIHLQ